jgi:Tfp pilus assembly protein PilV
VLEETMMEEQTKSSAKNEQQKGFTLIETAMALLVMMIGGLGICAVFAYAIKNNTGSRDRAAALAVAQQQMETYRTMNFTDAGMNATSTDPQPVIVTSADRTYAVRTVITDTTASMKTIQIQVTPQLSSASWSNSSVQIMSQRSTFALGAYTGGL